MSENLTMIKLLTYIQGRVAVHSYLGRTSKNETEREKHSEVLAEYNGLIDYLYTLEGISKGDKNG